VWTVQFSAPRKVTGANMTTRHLGALALIAASIAFRMDTAVGEGVSGELRECLAITD
jgi:hypothetical protein